MIIYNSFPVAQMVGTVKNSGLVFFRRNGINFARANTRPSNPQSEDQVRLRAFLTAASKNWSNLTAQQRQDWEDYAALYFNTGPNGAPVTPSGVGTYVKANSIRQVLGLSLTTNAPTEAPPAPLSEIEQASGTLPGEVGITLTHSYTVLTGLSVIVRATPAMPTAAVKPRTRDLRYVRGADAESALALVASGQDLVFTPSRYLVNDGERYGVEARIVRTADGIQSNPVFGDFIKVI